MTEATVAYAYHVPLDPENASLGLATKASRERVRAGDRIELPTVSKVGDEVAIDGSGHAEWEVVEVLAGADDGEHAGVRGWRGPPLVWDGTLVVRRVSTATSS